MLARMSASSEPMSRAHQARLGVNLGISPPCAVMAASAHRHLAKTARRRVKQLISGVKSTRLLRTWQRVDRSVAGAAAGTRQDH